VKKTVLFRKCYDEGSSALERVMSKILQKYE
jgi:hypothetical protein